ncbi:MAG: alanine racemase [Sporichthyaceae bacterium]
MLRLHIDRARFTAGLKGVHDSYPGLVPVAKGNGYGLGVARCAGYAAGLGVDSFAVGTTPELALLGEVPFSRVLVLTPHLAGDPAPTVPAALGDRVVHTAASLEAVADLTGRRIVVECRTSLRRHGLGAGDLAALPEALAGVRFEGFALHLPMDVPPGASRDEVAAWVDRLGAAGLDTATLWVSHLSSDDLADLARRYPATSFRPRIGTKLWLGDRGALRGKARVLDVEQIGAGERYGYRQRKARRAGRLLVVAGGTAHGIGLAAPKAVGDAKGRAKIGAEAGLGMVNRALSPFSWGGKQRWFAEPPHMQVSLLWLPGDVTPPRVGDWCDVETRLTTTAFDAVVED